ncbi:MAG TPA: hypothetical protein PLU37_10505 [Chitinophagaceae bacterium]|nr:hypothetical protein [Chitinophagaceae bacterium]
MKNIIGIAISVLILAGCYRDNEETLYPSTGTCDVSNVTYQQTVAPALQQYGCTSCHGGSAPSGNISLTSYDAVRIVALNGKLYGSINHNAGYSAMPKGGNKMNACTINKIKAWVDAGAVN